jgi:signal transduction histidine kinase
MLVKSQKRAFFDKRVIFMENRIEPSFKSFSYDNTLKTSFAEIVVQINKRLSEGGLYNQILDFTFESLSLLIPFDRIGIGLLNENKTNLTLYWVKSKASTEYLKTEFCAELEGSSLKNLIEKNEPRIIRDLIQYYGIHPQSFSSKLAIQDGIRSSLTFPLLANKKPIGVVFFSSFRPYTYDNQHIKIFQNIAEELAVIVEQASLRSHVKKSTEKIQSFRTIIHDLKAPLGIIQGFLEISREESWFNSLPSNALRTFGIIQKNTLYMIDLLDGYSELKRIDQENNFNPSFVDLYQFVNEMATYGKILAEKKEITLVAQISNDLPKQAYFEFLNMRRVIENLFINAIKFSNRRTQILFEVKADSNSIYFIVTDQGQGIPDNEISKLFKEFSRTSIRPTEGESSSGLGLAIIKKIVDRHQGHVSVKSCLKKGSQFTVTIPKVSSN